MLAGVGTGGMVPTFIFQPFDRVGAELCPCSIATGYAADLHCGLPIGDIYRPKGSPPTICVRVRAATRP